MIFAAAKTAAGRRCPAGHVRSIFRRLPRRLRTRCADILACRQNTAFAARLCLNGFAGRSGGGVCVFIKFIMHPQTTLGCIIRVEIFYFNVVNGSFE